MVAVQLLCAGLPLAVLSDCMQMRCKTQYRDSGGFCGCAVVAVRLSRAGLPLAVLSDCTAHALHLGMRAWMRVADSAFALSSYLSLLNPGAVAPGFARPCPAARASCGFRGHRERC